MFSIKTVKNWKNSNDKNYYDIWYIYDDLFKIMSGSLKKLPCTKNIIILKSRYKHFFSIIIKIMFF